MSIFFFELHVFLLIIIVWQMVMKLLFKRAMPATVLFGSATLFVLSTGCDGTDTQDTLKDLKNSIEGKSPEEQARIVREQLGVILPAPVLPGAGVPTSNNQPTANPLTALRGKLSKANTNEKLQLIKSELGVDPSSLVAQGKSDDEIIKDALEKKFPKTNASYAPMYTGDRIDLEKVKQAFDNNSTAVRPDKACIVQ
jgi:hypothetical protein